MSKTILRAFRNSYLAALVMLASSAFGQLKPVLGPGQIHEALKTLKASYLPYGYKTYSIEGTQDSGRLTYSNKKLWLRNDTGWVLVGTDLPTKILDSVRISNDTIFYRNLSSSELPIKLQGIKIPGVVGLQDSLSAQDLDMASKKGNIIRRTLLLDAGGSRFDFNTTGTGSARIRSLATAGVSFKPLLLAAGGVHISDRSGSPLTDDGVSALQVGGAGTIAGSFKLNLSAPTSGAYKVLVKNNSTNQVEHLTAAPWISGKILPSVLDLANCSAPDSIIFVTDSIRGGYFAWFETGDTDDGVTFAGSTGFYRRQFNHANGINARWYGLSANGVADDANRIQAAIDRASTDSVNKVIIPPGHYLIGSSLKLPSNFVLQAEPGAYIELEPGSNSYLVRNEDLTNGNSNIKVIGGHWNGNGHQQTLSLSGTVAGSNFCFGMFFYKSQNIEIGSLQIDSTRAWGIAAMESNRMHVHDIHFEQMPYKTNGDVGLAENGDGFTFGASNVLVENITGFTNDDMIAAGAGGAIFSGIIAPFAQNSYENITIRNIFPSVRNDSIPTWRSVGLYAINGKRLSNIIVDNVEGVTTAGKVIIANPLGDAYGGGLGFFDNIQLNNINGVSRSVAGFSASQFGIISIAAADVNKININGGNRSDPLNTSHVKTLDSAIVREMNISNINIKHTGGVLSRLVDDGARVKRLNISNVSLLDSLNITGQRLYDRAASPYISDTVFIRASSINITRPAGFSSISAGSGKVSFSSINLVIPDTAELSPVVGDVIITENAGLNYYQNFKWNSVNSIFNRQSDLVWNTKKSIVFAEPIPAGDFSIDVRPTGGGARDILRAGITGVSQGFTVIYNGVTLEYSFDQGAISLNGIKWLTGSGSPQGVVTAPVGSFYSNTSGGVGTSWYVKESGSGNTGWVAK